MNRLSYRADGLRMMAEFCPPANRRGPAPGVLVFPEAFGLGAHAISRAHRLSRMGYAALACDLHGEASRIDDLERVTALLKDLRAAPQRIHERALGALGTLCAQPSVDPRNIAAIGFCFGGTIALELARINAGLRAVVGFHSNLAALSPSSSGAIASRVLVCIGGEDSLIPASQRQTFEQEMRAAKADWQMHLFGGAVHSFTDVGADQRDDIGRFRYDAYADRASWALMSDFLAESFSTSDAGGAGEDCGDQGRNHDEHA